MGHVPEVLCLEHFQDCRHLLPLGIHHAAALQVGDGGNSEGLSGLNYYTNTNDHRAPPSTQ